jgi:hypothetical protein
MKVGELIELLQKEDPNRLVIIQKDGEGNGYSPLSDYMLMAYKAENTWSGHIGFEELTQDLYDQGYGEDDIITNGEKALILVPVN